MHNPQLRFLEDIKKLKYNKPKRPLLISTDCSGIEAPIMALNILKIPHINLWNSDIDENVIKSIEHNYKKPVIGTFRNMMKRNNSKLLNFGSSSRAKIPNPDIYVAGFPCQSFSNLGYGDGFNDYKNRGIVFFGCLDTIINTKPIVFILENVKGLLSNKNGDTFNTIINELKNINEYNIYYKLLNTIDYGLPHYRERLYIIGIRKNYMVKDFKFPEPLELKISVEDIMIKDYKKPTVLTKHKEKVLKDLYYHNKINKNENWLVNLNVSSYKRSSPMLNISPCLMAQGAIYYSTKYKRNLIPREFLRLQGFSDDFFEIVSNNQIYKQAGNSMSTSVLIMLYIELFNTVNFD